MQATVAQFYSQLSLSEKEMLCNYLRNRFTFQRNPKRIGVVFDVLHSCVLQCLGCGTNAYYQETADRVNCNPSLLSIEKTFRKLRSYADDNGKTIFMNIGGGEPFLRSDIDQIIQMSAAYFGKENVGVDTNAALPDADVHLSDVMPYLSYVGVSINGLHDYHNWWAHCNKFDAFTRSIQTVSSLCTKEDYRDKIEVTSVATKGNLRELPELASLLAHYNVGNYSVHRPIAVGRMAGHPDLLPNAAEYLRLFVDLLTVTKKENLRFHIHHSIESIHAALLLGIDTYSYEHVGNPDALSSIGIDPECNLVFDPWCTTGFWRKLTSGNLLTDQRPLEEMIHSEDSVFRKTAAYTSPENKCNGCPIHCSGGSRIVAATHELIGKPADSIATQDIYSAMRAVDPACPLYQEKSKRQ